MDAPTMILHLKELFGAQSRVERYQISKALFQCKMTEGSSVNTHVLKMIGYIEKLAELGFVMDHELSIDLVLQSLSSSFSQFVMNFNMNQKDMTLPELLNMLKTAEGCLKKEPSSVLVVSSSKSKKKGSKKNKNKKQKASTNVVKAKGGVKKKSNDKGTCFNCRVEGHWKRNCPSYLASLKEKRLKEADSSGMFMIEINLSTSVPHSWVLDTGCGSHLCNNMQMLTRSRSLKKGEVDLRVGNGARVAALAVGTCSLALPSGLILELDNCYYVPVITRNIISISHLDLNGFVFIIKNNSCSFYKDDVYYGSGLLTNGLYELDLVRPILNINSKKSKLSNQTPSYLWHCRLGHINETRITKLHKEGYLDPFDYESYEICESCLLGKMTKLPFKGKGQRSSELLELVHSDVCGPMSTNARGGYTYFITFTDDHSRYGYVYLMKQKSESFEKFKEFRLEVEKQTGKSIKTLRSDRGGEYLDHEFLGYLKENGILSQWSPPATPQHNGVSERRNRTLLDMVRSMMSHAGLPISFWGYAIETAIYLLNKVPSKSVDKTPYEIWTGRRPGLSHLKIWGCDAYVKRTISDKLQAKSDKCKFVGYPKETSGYQFYHPIEQKVFVSRHATFLEKEFILKESSGSEVELREVQEPQIHIDMEQEPQVDTYDVQ